MSSVEGQVGDDDSVSTEQHAAGRGQVSYDCTPWAGETRRILRAVLEGRAIPHAWEGTVVVVPVAFTAEVDEIVDDVSATARASLSEGEPTVAYEMTPWSAESQNALVDSLAAETIAYEWDADGDLVVYERDADQVEGLIGQLGEPDGGDEIDGIELHERLSVLFVAVDRLVHDPYDLQLGRSTIAAAESLVGVALPFGFDPYDWRAVGSTAGELTEALTRASAGEGATAELDDTDGEDGAEASVETSAKRLRDLLRRFV